jgi:putative transposase
MRTSARTRYAGYRFPTEIISHAVWLYFRFHARAAHGGGVAGGPRHHSQPRNRPTMGRVSSASSLPTRSVAVFREWPTNGIWTRSCSKCRGKALALASRGPGRRRARRPGPTPAQQAAAKRLLRKLLKKQMRPPRVMITTSLPATARLRGRSCPALSIASTRDPTTERRIRTSRHGDESGKCSDSNRPVRRSAPSQPTIRSITSFTSAAITSLPPNIELPGPKIPGLGRNL